MPKTQQSNTCNSGQCWDAKQFEFDIKNDLVGPPQIGGTESKMYPHLSRWHSRPPTFAVLDSKLVNKRGYRHDKQLARLYQIKKHL
jgi:hypothetical protein